MALPETPLTRGEQYLAKAAGQDTAIPDVPLARMEQYLAKIAGQDVALPDAPLTRVEQYLAYIAENGGGGNPNTQQTIQGTVANPWGDVSYSELAAALANGDAHAILRFSFNGNNVVTPLISYNGSTVFGSVANIAENLTNSVAVNIRWDSGTVIYARAVTAGQVQDVTAYTSGIQSNLIIYWHPMPD